MKECPKCRMCWEDSDRHCGECGTRFGGEPTAASIGAEWGGDAAKAAEHLHSGESAKFYSSGLVESTILGKDAKRNAVILATDKRLLIYCSKMFGGYELEEIPYSAMSSIEIGKGLLGHSATFIASSNRARITMMNKGQPERLISFVKSQIGLRPPVVAAPTPPQATPASGIDFVEKIQESAALMDRGLLTSEEFRLAKKKLLDPK
jgi:hypothetical protein